MSNEDLTYKQKRFCEEYILDWNGSRAYKVAYPNIKNDETARAGASRLLTYDNVKLYIKEIQADLEKISGVSRLKVLNEYKKLAFSSIAHLHNTWVERAEFEQLTEDQKSCIESIDTKVIKKKGHELNKDGNFEVVIYDVEYVKIKLYDKQKALDSISKMLGYNEPEKKDITTNGESINFGNMTKAELDKLEDELSE